MEQDSRIHLSALKVDGGAVKNSFLLQFQADLSGIPVVRPRRIESTALGAAQLAGVGVGLWSRRDLTRMRAVERVFRPKWKSDQRKKAMTAWTQAVRRAL